jgi:hypothetical protein
VLLLGLLAIVVWQAGFARSPGSLPDSHRMSASTGLNSEYRFVYFFYYLGLYPVTSSEGHVTFLGEPGYRRYSREAAERLIRERGRTLQMEWKHTVRVGEPGKLFLYMLDALLKGEPRLPLSLRPANQAVFVASLCAAFGAFWYAGMPLIGGLLALLVGSNPFQLFQVYARENVFGWPISVGLLTLAINLPLLRRGRGPSRWLLLVPLATGALLATLAQVRTEPITILASAALACVFVSGASTWRRVALLAVLIASFALVWTLWAAWFEARFQEARRVVAAAGGHPYDGPRDTSHAFWHPIWCGLGDFDTRYGYVWSDTAAARYAHPILRDVYKVDVPDWDFDSWGYYTAFWDPGRRYYKMPYEMPHYSDVVRDKVLGDIARDPAWYGGILARRAWRLLSETTPARLTLGSRFVTLPWTGLLVPPLLALLALTRSWTLLKLACFPLSTSIPAFVVYSGNGMSFYSWYHLMAAAIVASILLQLGGAWAARRLRRTG